MSEKCADGREGRGGRGGEVGERRGAGEGRGGVENREEVRTGHETRETASGHVVYGTDCSQLPQRSLK